jgi:septum site-determining protein MinC
MSKIAIISQPDQGVLIDVGGCSTLQEATHHLTSTLQISSEFWAGLNVDLNLGELALTEGEVAQVLAIASEVGIKPHAVFATNELTRSALTAQNAPLAEGKPMTLAVGPMVTDCDEKECSSHLNQQESIPSSSDSASEAKDDSQPAEGDTASGASAAQAVKQAVPPTPAVLYLRQTLRSGQSVSHKGHLVIVGDVNPGAEVIAEGDITVWGALRGMAHAGCGGNSQAEIRALRLEPIQIRIAHAIARSPDRPRKKGGAKIGPETARVVNGTIRITANNPE